MQVRFAAVVLALAIGSCTEPSSSLTGHWVEVVWPNRHLVLKSDRSFSNYGGSGSDYWRHEGRYDISGTSIEFQPQRYVSKAAPSSPETVVEPSPYASIFDDCVFEFEGRELVLQYTTYPFDGPEPTTMRLRRE